MDPGLLIGFYESFIGITDTNSYYDLFPPSLTCPAILHPVEALPTDSYYYCAGICGVFALGVGIRWCKKCWQKKETPEEVCTPCNMIRHSDSENNSIPCNIDS